MQILGLETRLEPNEAATPSAEIVPDHTNADADADADVDVVDDLNLIFVNFYFFSFFTSFRLSLPLSISHLSR